MIQPEQLQPGNEPERGFPTAEFEQRLRQIQGLMATSNIDVLMLSAEADVRYYSGYHTQFWQSPTRPWFLLVPQSGTPVAVIPAIGVACMSRTWISDIRTWSSPHPYDDGITLLSDTLSELAGQRATIGLQMGRESCLRMPLQDFYRLQASLPQAHWSNATEIIQSQQQVKSRREIDKIRHACSIVSTVFNSVPEMLHAGITEIEAFKRFKLACLEHGVDDTAYLVGGAGAGGYDDIISPPTQRELQSGDVLMLDTGCVWNGYFCDFDRNFSLGAVSPKVADAYRITWEATEAGLAAARPGASCSDLFRAMNEVMSEHAVGGKNDVGRLGHGLGMQLTESPSITAFDQTVLRPGMVITLEPGYRFAENKMMVHEEDIVIRENGAELITTRAAAVMPTITG